MKVGALTLATVMAGVLILRFVDNTDGAEGGYRLYLLLRDVTGIAVRSHVRVAGIPIGHVEDIRLDGNEARVDLRINPDVALFEDATATKTTRNLLGEYHLVVTPGTRGKRQLVDGDRIENVSAGSSPDDVLQTTARVAEAVERITASLADTVGTDEGRNNMRETLQNLAGVTAALNQTVRENRESIRNILTGVERVTSQGQGDAVAILENVRVVTAELRRLLAGTESGDPGAREKVTSLVDQLSSATESLDQSLRNIESTTGRIDRGEGTLGRLTRDETLINDVEGVTGEIGDYVSRLSQLRTILSLRTDYQFRAQTVKSFVELRLQPREDKYYSVEIVNDPRGLTRIEQVNVNTTNPNDPSQFQEIRSTTSNALRFSLQFAQQFGPFVGRFGLKESTGGVGLDVLALNDAFELRQDLFGFGEVVRPRWRLSLAYAFLNRLWLMGGVDDILSVDRREYFVGMRLRFDDDDLKSVLPFAPTP
jgi:phospholipid/cholesterol/gamma-HCH transport system substrate-binding protein